MKLIPIFLVVDVILTECLGQLFFFNKAIAEWVKIPSMEYVHNF